MKVNKDPPLKSKHSGGILGGVAPYHYPCTLPGSAIPEASATFSGQVTIGAKGWCKTLGFTFILIYLSVKVCHGS